MCPLQKFSINFSLRSMFREVATTDIKMISNGDYDEWNSGVLLFYFYFVLLIDFIEADNDIA